MENQLVNSSKHSSGFTLIELIIVIVIIGILAGMGLATFPSAQKKARDAQRISDLGQYRIAMEAYSSNNNQNYPGGPGGLQGWAICNSNLCSLAASGAGFLLSLMPYMNGQCLYDPHRISSGQCASAYCNDTFKNYQYCWVGGNATTWGAVSPDYLLYAKLEAGGYWVVCSNGKSGKYDSTSPPPASFTCPI